MVRPAMDAITRYLRWSGCARFSFWNWNIRSVTEWFILEPGAAADGFDNVGLPGPVAKRCQCSADRSSGRRRPSSHAITGEFESPKMSRGTPIEGICWQSVASSDLSGGTFARYWPRIGERTRIFLDTFIRNIPLFVQLGVPLCLASLCGAVSALLDHSRGPAARTGGSSVRCGERFGSAGGVVVVWSRRWR